MAIETDADTELVYWMSGSYMAKRRPLTEKPRV